MIKRKTINRNRLRGGSEVRNFRVRGENNYENNAKRSTGKGGHKNEQMRNLTFYSTYRTLSKFNINYMLKSLLIDYSILFLCIKCECMVRIYFLWL